MEREEAPVSPTKVIDESQEEILKFLEIASSNSKLNAEKVLTTNNIFTEHNNNVVGSKRCQVESSIELRKELGDVLVMEKRRRYVIEEKSIVYTNNNSLSNATVKVNTSFDISVGPGSAIKGVIKPFLSTEVAPVTGNELQSKGLLADELENNEKVTQSTPKKANFTTKTTTVSNENNAKSGGEIRARRPYLAPPGPWSSYDEKQMLLPQSWQDDPLEKLCLFCGQRHARICGLKPSNIECTNEFCHDSRPHILQYCPTLHHRCDRCRLRGHFEKQCQGTLESARRAFLAHADHGMLTCQRHTEIGFGLFPIFVETWPQTLSKEQFRLLESRAGPHESITAFNAIGYECEHKLKENFRLSYMRRCYELDVLEESCSSRKAQGPVVNVDPYKQRNGRARARAFLAVRRYAFSKGIRVRLPDEICADISTRNSERDRRRQGQNALIAELKQSLDSGQLRLGKYYMKKNEKWLQAKEEDTIGSRLPTILIDDRGKFHCFQGGRAANHPK